MRTVFTMAIALCMGFPVAAQQTASNRVVTSGKGGFGIKGGLNVAGTKSGGFGTNTSSIVFQDPGVKLGYHVGAFYTIPVSGILSLQPEVLFSTEGSWQDAVENGTSFNANKLDMNYIQIPVLLKFSAASGFYGELGPQLGFITKTELTTSRLNLQGSTTSLDDFTASTAWAGVAGIGYSFKSGLGFGARYVMGLTNPWENTMAMDVDLSTRTFAFSLHYRF